MLFSIHLWIIICTSFLFCLGKCTFFIWTIFPLKIVKLNLTCFINSLQAMLHWCEVKILWCSIILIRSFRVRYFLLAIIFYFFNFIDTINDIWINNLISITFYILVHLFILVFLIIMAFRLNEMLFIFRDIRESSYISLQHLYKYLLSIIRKINHFLVQNIINNLIISTLDSIIIFFASLYSIRILHWMILLIVKSVIILVEFLLYLCKYWAN